MPPLCIYHHAKFHQKGFTCSFYMNFLRLATNMVAVTLTFKLSKRKKKSGSRVLPNVPKYKVSSKSMQLLLRYLRLRTHARTYARTHIDHFNMLSALPDNIIKRIHITRTYLSQTSHYKGAILKAQPGFEPGSMFPRGIVLSTESTGLPNVHQKERNTELNFQAEITISEAIIR
jgi:hypothetical protein